MKIKNILFCEGQSSDLLHFVKGKVPEGQISEGQSSGRTKFSVYYKPRPLLCITGPVCVCNDRVPKLCRPVDRGPEGNSQN